MPLFKYIAQKNDSGEIYSGKIDAPDKVKVSDVLFFQGAKVLEINEIQPSVFTKITNHHNVKANDLILFSKQFYTLTKSGIPLFKCIDILLIQTQNKDLKEVIKTIKKELLEGVSLADAMRLFPDVFSNFFVSLVLMGESNGKLDQAMCSVADYLEKKRNLANKIINALVYPILLMVMGIIVVIIMVTFVLPRFVVVFEQNELEMPWFTKLLLNISLFISQHYIFLFILLGFILMFVVYLYSNKKTRIHFDHFIVMTPVIGNVIYSVAIARFVRILGTLYGTGVPLLNAIEVATAVIHNKYIEHYIVTALASVKDGKGLATPLRESKKFPPIVVEMLATGEETGTLDSLSLEAADFLDSETEQTLKTMVALIEPLVLILIGILVAMISASFLMPIFKLGTSIHR